MRIDLVYGNAPFADAVTDAYVDREARKGSLKDGKGPSDHAPARRRPRALSPSREHGGRARLARRVAAMPLDVRPIDAETHRAFVEERSASFLQLPVLGRGQGRVGAPRRWAGSTARPSSAPGSSCCGAPPGIERYLAYLPEGPVVDWTTYDVARRARPARRRR